MIEHWTDIEMKKTKRNKRKQAIHLAGARAIQNINDPEGTWRGRHHETLENSKVAAAVNEWMANHPDSTNKSACARDLNLSRTTVIKWWNEIENTIVESPYDFNDGLLEPGTFASEADPYEEELTRLQQEIIESITRDSNMGAGVFEGETMEVPDIE